MKVVLNGRFLCAPPTGVQRVAGNLILALDELLADRAAGSRLKWEVRAPRGRKRALPLSAMAFHGRSVLRGQAWEQLELPIAAEGGRLVNLSNVGPVMAPSALTMIHDAQVYLAPESYTAAFGAWYRAALPRLAARSRLVLTVSEFSRAMLARFGVADPARIRVVPNGVDHMLKAPADGSVIARLGLADTPFVFVFGSLQAHKNLGVVLRAFADRRLRDLRLVVSGDLDRASITEAFGVFPGANVLMAGRLTDAEVRALLEAAVCLACPSTTEGFGLPPLEAMILGCPALVAPAGAMPEVCGAAAAYAPADDVDAWAGAIRELADESGARAARVRAGRAHASQFTWRRSAERLHALVEEVL